MKKGLTEIILLLDKSGSMEKIRNDVIGGINTYIDLQKDLPGECKFSFYQFDHQNDWTSQAYLTLFNNNPFNTSKLSIDDKESVSGYFGLKIKSVFEGIDIKSSVPLNKQNFVPPWRNSIV